MGGLVLMKPLEWSEGDTKKVRWSTVGTPAQYVKVDSRDSCRVYVTDSVLYSWRW